MTCEFNISASGQPREDPNTTSPTGTSAERRLEMAGDQDVDHLGPGIRRALGVRKMMQQRKLASTMPDKYFKELEWLELVAPTSATVSVKILSIVRIPRKTAKCGSFLMLVTVNGKVILDDTDIKFDDAIGSLFQEAGFDMLENQHAVEVDGNGQSRRLTAANGFSATGFFNVIDDMEWKCTTVAKPEFPAVYSSKVTRLRKCVDKDGQDHCKVEMFDGEVVPIHGVIEENGVAYIKEHSNTYVDSSSQISVVTKPYHPGVRQVTHANNGETVTYQVGADGVLSHCTLHKGEDSMALPDDFIFHYVGLVDEMRHFRISYQPDNPYEEGKKFDMWEHIDYFDDATTKLPKIIILSDESILRFDEIKQNQEMRSFREEGIQFEGLHFDQCIQVKEMITNGTFRTFKSEYNVGNLTLPPLNGTSLEELEPDSYEFQIHAWNWTKSYPPEAHAPLSMNEDDVMFYIEHSKIDVPAIKEWNEWLNHTTVTLSKDLQHRARRLYDVQNYMANRRLQELDEEELRGMEMKRKKGQHFHDAQGRALWKWETKADTSKKELWAKLTHGKFFLHFGVKKAKKADVKKDYDIIINDDDIYLNFFIKCRGCYSAFCFYGGVDAYYPLIALNGAPFGGGYVKVILSMSSFIDSLSLWWPIKTALKTVMPKDMTLFSVTYKYKVLEIDKLGGKEVWYRSKQGIVGWAGLNKQEIFAFRTCGWWDCTNWGGYLTAKIGYEWDKWQSKRMYEKKSSGGGEIWRHKAVVESKFKHVKVYTDPSNSNRDIIDFGSGSKQKVDVRVDYKINIPLYSSSGWKNVMKKTLFEKSQNEAVADSDKEKGVEIGVTRTTGGYKCQSWSQIYPHKHIYSWLGDNNFCANPDHDAGGAWCYTTDPNKRFGYCNVKQTKTRSGYTCQNWNSQRPHRHGYTNVGNHNYCRNPDGDSFDWCITTNPNKFWEYCSG
eukprot:g12336.t1